MKRDAEENAEKDKKAREEIDIKNSADNLVYQTEKLINENGDKVSEGVKNEIEKSKESLSKALSENDIDKIKETKDKLQEDLQKASEEMYKNTSSENESGEEPIDAEIVD